MAVNKNASRQRLVAASVVMMNLVVPAPESRFFNSWVIPKLAAAPVAST